MNEWRYSSIILDLGTRWRWVVSFTSLPLYPRYSLIGGWVAPRAGLDAGEKRKVLHFRELNPGRPVRRSPDWQRRELAHKRKTQSKSVGNVVLSGVISTSGDQGCFSFRYRPRLHSMISYHRLFRKIMNCCFHTNLKVGRCSVYINLLCATLHFSTASVV
jgi:hypothetical protein